MAKKSVVASWHIVYCRGVPRARGLKSKQGKLQIEQYIETCQAILRLSDWHIKYLPAQDPAKDAEADISPQRGKVAHLRVAKQFFTHTPEQQRNIIAHELTHLILYRLDDLATDLDKVMAPCTYSFFFAQYEEAEEDAVESLCLLIEQLLPLPKWT